MTPTEPSPDTSSHSLDDNGLDTVTEIFQAMNIQDHRVRVHDRHCNDQLLRHQQGRVVVAFNMSGNGNQAGVPAVRQGYGRAVIAATGADVVLYSESPWVVDNMIFRFEVEARSVQFQSVHALRDVGILYNPDVFEASPPVQPEDFVVVSDEDGQLDLVNVPEGFAIPNGPLHNPADDAGLRTMQFRQRTAADQLRTLRALLRRLCICVLTDRQTGGKLVMVSVHGPHVGVNQDNRELFLSLTLKLVREYAHRLGLHVVIGGDFNLDLDSVQEPALLDGVLIPGHVHSPRRTSSVDWMIGDRHTVPVFEGGVRSVQIFDFLPANHPEWVIPHRNEFADRIVPPDDVFDPWAEENHRFLDEYVDGIPNLHLFDVRNIFDHDPMRTIVHFYPKHPLHLPVSRHSPKK